MSSHKKRDMVPINLCAKFDPPMIALHYRLKNEKDKTYVHDMQVTCGNLNSEEIYTQLCEMEKPYLDGKSIPKSQIIKLLDKIVAKSQAGTLNQQSPKKLETTKVENNKEVIKTLSEEGDDYTDNNKAGGFLNWRKNKRAADKTEEVKKSENISKVPKQDTKIAEPKSAVPKMEKGEKNALSNLPQLNKKEAKKKEGKKDMAGDIDNEQERNENDYELDFENMDDEEKAKIYQQMLKEGYNPEEDEEEDMQFQKVFVEELGKELLMDEQGNLFDLDGNFIGRASNDDNDAEEAVEDNETDDDKYFEDRKSHELP